MTRPKRLKPAVQRDGSTVPDAVSDHIACMQADALMAIFRLHRVCRCNGTGVATRLSLDGTHTVSSACWCGADPHAAALAEWVDV